MGEDLRGANKAIGAVGKESRAPAQRINNRQLVGRSLQVLAGDLGDLPDPVLELDGGRAIPRLKYSLDNARCFSRWHDGFQAAPECFLGRGKADLTALGQKVNETALGRCQLFVGGGVGAQPQVGAGLMRASRR